MRTTSFPSTGLALTGVVVAGILLSAFRDAPVPPASQADAAPSIPVELAPAAGDSSSPARLADASADQDLPLVEVPQRTVHSVPDDEPPTPRPVTLKGRNGRDMRPRTGTQLAAHPVVPALPAPAPVPMVMIKGAARVGDLVALTVQGRTVPLFGVRPPQVGDRCAPAPQAAPRRCGEVARAALAARLAANAAVSCRIPPGQRASVPAAICLDSTGVDLAGYLVGEGLALADTAQSYDYAGAEGVARSTRRGLWRYR